MRLSDNMFKWNEQKHEHTTCSWTHARNFDSLTRNALMDEFFFYAWNEEMDWAALNVICRQKQTCSNEKWTTNDECSQIFHGEACVRCLVGRKGKECKPKRTQINFNYPNPSNNAAACCPLKFCLFCLSQRCWCPKMKLCCSMMWSDDDCLKLCYHESKCCSLGSPDSRLWKLNHLLGLKKKGENQIKTFIIASSEWEREIQFFS